MAQDDESQEILDIIFNERTYDLGVVFNWGDCRAMVNNSAISSASATWSSTVDSMLPAIEAAMQDTIDGFNRLG